MSPEDLRRGLQKKDRRALGQAITLVESRHPKRRQQALELLAQLEPSTQSLRVGISGPPGVGKSTFIETLGLQLIDQGHQVAILAVDPSSSVSGGSILGDKTRMPILASHNDAFIRPSPAGDTLGGVARRTRESILICEAAGYDRIIVETVGVGQSETSVRTMVDIFLLLQQPFAGDDLQGMKKGILELADLIVINKSDGKTVKAAQKTMADLHAALGLVYDRDEVPPILCCSALEKRGFDEVIAQLNKMADRRRQSGYFQRNRQNQAGLWFDQGLKDELMAKVLNEPGLKEYLLQVRQEVNKLTLPPSAAVQKIVDQLTIQLKG
jgi:LAO/AO transport system kinase